MNGAGDLAGGELGGELLVPGLLQRIWLARESGELLLVDGRLKKKIFFREGRIDYCATNAPAERLGAVLLAEGRIGAEALAQAVRHKGDRRLGQVLVESGLLERGELSRCLDRTTRQNVYELLRWRQGSWRFSPPGAELPAELRFNLPTAEILLEGVRRLEEFEAIERALGNRGQAVRLCREPPAAEPQLPLSPVEGFLLSRVDGRLTLDEICSLSAVQRGETLRCLFGLLCAGIVEYVAEGSPEGAPAPGAERIEAGAGVEGSAAGGGPWGSAGGGEAGPAAGGEPATRGEEESVEASRQAILAKYAATCQEEPDYYAVLEVPREADERRIRQAYYRLAKSFHPDRHRQPHLEDLREKLEALFMVIGEAQEVLRSPSRRAEHDERLARRQEGGEEQPGRPAAGGGAPVLFQEGMRFLREKDYWNAVQLFRQAVELEGDNAEYRRLLAQALSYNPKWVKEAELHLLRAVELEPYSAELQLLLGRLYRDSGLLHRAAARYREALRLDPEHAPAQRELAELERDGGVEKGARVGGLFRRKK